MGELQLPDHHSPLRAKLIQLVREWPPGYGGIERVAHELAVAWQSNGLSCLTVSLKSRPRLADPDPLPVSYPRSSIPHLTLGQLLIPLPHPRVLSVLLSSAPLHVHLPCPGLLSLTVLARLLRPGRRITLHWHVFLAPGGGVHGCLIGLYQWLALRWACLGVQQVITTSPMLASALRDEGVPASRLAVMPCCVGESTERVAEAIWQRRLQIPEREPEDPFRLLFIGRLDSYKRVDWLIEAFAASTATTLDIVGEGPLRAELEALARRVSKAAAIRFHGRAPEHIKAELLEQSELLVLPADRSNEAFGIVQLESMACGVPALALEHSRSGVTWVGGLGESLGNPPPWPLRHRQDLAAAISLLASDPELHHRASVAARQRYDTLFARAIWKRHLLALPE